MKRRSALQLTGLAGALVLARTVCAQPADGTGWPNRPIRMVIPFAPGGGADRVGRMVAEPLGRALGQPIVVENRPGGGGTLAAAHVAASPADGYTLFYGTPGQLTTLPILMASLPYNAERDFAPVSLLIRSAYGIGVHPSVPARSLAELIALAKRQPGRLAYATAGVGSGPHLAGELLKFMAGIDITHVPYRGSALAIQDVVGGQVPISIDSQDLIGPQIHSGAIRGLAVTSTGRSILLPELPPAAETVPGYEVTVFNYIAVRTGTPSAIVERLSREIRAVVARPDFIKRNRELGTEAVGSTPEELGRLWQEEARKWREVITRAGIRIE
jgi:tripartite-type tricarboxylate transporter receptor subunit TctC